jgi:hypothetical protein
MQEHYVTFNYDLGEQTALKTEVAGTRLHAAYSGSLLVCFKKLSDCYDYTASNTMLTSE